MIYSSRIIYSQRKKNNDEVPNGYYLETRSKAEADNKLEHIAADVDNHADTPKLKRNKMKFNRVRRRLKINE